MHGERPWPRLLARWCRFAATHGLPADCFGCGRRLSRHHLGACPSCWAALVPLATACCARCAIPLEGSDPAGRLCLRCLRRPFPLDEALAAVAYRGVARQFLLRAKERGRPELLRPLAEQLLTATAASGIARRADVVVPVPSSLRSRIRRGFIPARELARIVARGSSLPWSPDGLRKRGLAGQAFKGLGAAERLEQARNAIDLRDVFRGAQVLLVDDVMTTGATLAACGHALRRAGVLSVRAAVWARTPDPGDRFDQDPEGRL